MYIFIYVFPKNLSVVRKKYVNFAKTVHLSHNLMGKKRTLLASYVFNPFSANKILYLCLFVLGARINKPVNT